MNLKGKPLEIIFWNYQGKVPPLQNNYNEMHPYDFQMHKITSNIEFLNGLLMNTKDSLVTTSAAHKTMFAFKRSATVQLYFPEVHKKCSWKGITYT